MRATGRLALFLFLAHLAGAAVAQTAIQVENPWVREAPPGARVLAVYMTLKNRSGQPDRLVRAESPIARAAELHQTRGHEGMMRMEPVPAIEVPAHGQAVLAPNRYHIMLVEPVRSVKAGETVPLRLFFGRGPEITLDVPVRAANGGAAPGTHKGH